MAGFKQNSPGCCCGCTIFGDEFLRANSTNVGGDWTEVQGDWYIGGGTELRIADPDSIILCPAATTAVSGPMNCYIEAHRASNGTFGLATVGDTWWLILGYEDVNNFYFAELAYNTVSGAPIDKLSINRREAGVDTQLVESADIGINGAISFCYREETQTLVAMVGQGGYFPTTAEDMGGYTAIHYVLDDPIPNTATGVGLGVATIGATYSAFERVYFSVINPTCDVCSWCAKYSRAHDMDDPPDEVQVVVAGVSGTTGCPSGCSPLNGTYVLSAETGVGYGINPMQCFWLTSLPTVCDYDWLQCFWSGVGVSPTGWVVKFVREPTSTAGFDPQINSTGPNSGWLPTFQFCGTAAGTGIGATVTPL